MLKACLNGARHPTDHPALPVSVDDLAADVRSVSRAGADAVHLHVKDDEGNDTLDDAALAAVLAAARAAAPALPVGVTTGAWALPDPGARLAAVRAWGRLPLRPDFASVNWHEEGADQVAGALVEIGVGVEAGLWHAEAAEAWLASAYRDRCLRVLLELPDGLGPADVAREAGTLLDLVRRAPAVDGAPVPVLLHGEGTSAWPAVRLAGSLGLATRIGLEDVLVLPDGSPARDNAALVRAARRLLQDVPSGSAVPGNDR